MFVFSIIAIVFFFIPPLVQAGEVKQSGCVICHQSFDEKFIIHRSKKVGCGDCHGGDPDETKEKLQAHKGMIALKRNKGRKEANRICTRCHEEPLYGIGAIPGSEREGDECRTCHITRIPSTSCLDCHLDGDSRHRMNSAISEEICRKCHESDFDKNFFEGADIHQRAFLTCVDCHSSKKFGTGIHPQHRNGVARGIGCDNCHNATSDKPARENPGGSRQDDDGSRELIGQHNGKTYLIRQMSRESHPIAKHMEVLTCRSCHFSPFAADGRMKIDLVFARQTSGKVDIFQKASVGPWIKKGMFPFGPNHNIEKSVIGCADCHQRIEQYLNHDRFEHHGTHQLEKDLIRRISTIGICLTCHDEASDALLHLSKYGGEDALQAHLKSIDR